jgi:hypothetical protein
MSLLKLHVYQAHQCHQGTIGRFFHHPGDKGIVGVQCTCVLYCIVPLSPRRLLPEDYYCTSTLYSDDLYATRPLSEVLYSMSTVPPLYLHNVNSQTTCHLQELPVHSRNCLSTRPISMVQYFMSSSEGQTQY